MTLPNLIGIGVPRAGTTWLYQLLASHPDVYMSPTKEIHFFDWHYSKGEKWYRQFFKGAGREVNVIGEYTPHYLYYPGVPERIAAMPSINKLMVMLRNPVDRTFSHYIWQMQLDNYQGSFEDFLEDYPDRVEKSHYSTNLRRFFEWFDRDQLLVLIHERAFRDIEGTIDQIAEFLEIGYSAFPEEAGERRVNTAKVPRYPYVRQLASQTGHFLRNANLGWLADVGARVGIKRLLDQPQPRPQMNEKTRAELFDYYTPEISELELLLGTSLDEWT